MRVKLASVVSLVLFVGIGCDRLCAHYQTITALVSEVDGKLEVRHVLKKGTVLEWKPLPGTPDFLIEFVGESPCEDSSGKANNFKATQRSPARCTVKAQPAKGKEYSYAIQKDYRPVTPCKGCFYRAE